MSQKSVKFHIKSNDYFGTIATILSFIRQTSKNGDQYLASINKLEKDLIFLQKIIK